MIFSTLQKLSLVPSYLWDAIWAPVWKRCMKQCGKGVYLRPMSSDIKGLWNLSVGDGTSIPKGSTIYCTDAPCTIGKKVIFGPKPTIITGDHRIDVIGKHLIDVTVEEKYALCEQIRRAVISVTSNIAEGTGRISVREQMHFLEISYGFLMEVLSQMDIALDLGYIDSDDFCKIEQQCNNCASLISGLRSYLDRSLNSKH